MSEDAMCWQVVLVHIKAVHGRRQGIRASSSQSAGTSYSFWSAQLLNLKIIAIAHRWIPQSQSSIPPELNWQGERRFGVVWNWEREKRRSKCVFLSMEFLGGNSAKGNNRTTRRVDFNR
jgi:hypothetical protein